MNYRPDIQGLRAVAVLLVMLFHFNPAWLPGGFVGVDVFLLISGYLIVSILMEKREQPGYKFGSTLRSFYVSRFKRIAPAYFAMLVLVSLLAAVLLLPQDFAVYKAGLKQAVWFNSNHYFADFGDYFAPANHEQPLLHTWSLAVEIQFYLLAPLLVLLLPIRTLKWLFLALLIGLTAVAEYRLRVLGFQQATYYSLYARLPEFFAGGLLAMYSRSLRGEVSPWFSGLGLVFVLASAVAQPQLGPFPGLAALLPVAGAVFVLLNPTPGPSARLLTNKPMVWLGRMSYSLYLWHWPVLAFLRYYTGSSELDIPFSLLFVTLTLLLATLSFYLVETPLRVRHTGFKQALSYALLTGAALATSPGMARINHSWSSPLPVEYMRYADPATICHGQIVRDCLRGDLNSDSEVLVLGDSHAAMLNLFFDQLGKDLGFKARIITASSCVTIPGFDHQRIAEWAQEPCLEQIEQAKKYLPATKIVIVAAKWSWQLTSKDFRDAFDAFLAETTRAGNQVIVFEQVSMLSKNPLRALRFKTLGMNPTVELDPAYLEANATLRHMVARHQTASTVNFSNFGFSSETLFIDGMPIYFDEHHLNEEGSRRYAAAARSAFRELVD